jgi:hypothetical protein
MEAEECARNKEKLGRDRKYVTTRLKSLAPFKCKHYLRVTREPIISN